MAKTISCSLTAAQQKTHVTFKSRPLCPLSVGEIVEATCKATEALKEACIKNAVKITKEKSKYEGMYFTQFVFPFTTKKDGKDLTIQVRCEQDVEPGKSYSVMCSTYEYKGKEIKEAVLL